MLFRSVLASLALWVLFFVGVRAAVIPPENCGLNNEDAIQRAAAAAVGWIKNNQQPDGRYVYLYYSDTDTTPPEYNEVRHAGVTMSLYQAADRMQDSDALVAADSALHWMIENTVRRSGWAALAPGGQRASLGASALMLVSLAERRQALHDPQYDGLMRELAAFLVELQRDDGGFHVAYDLTTDKADTHGASRYYPGEALWALALTHEVFPGEGWDVAANRALEFITTVRDQVESVDFPPLADQWTAYGIAEMVEWGLTDHQVDYALRLAARFGLLVRTEAQREGSLYGHLARGKFSRAAGSGTWAEGLAALWRASNQDERLADLQDPIRDRLICVSGILAQRQVSSEEAALYPQPALAAGAWFRNSETRMDDQQHALSGLIYTLDAIRGNAIREPLLPLPRPLQ